MRIRANVAWLGLLLLPAIAVAQTSELYLTTYSDTRAFVVQGGKVIRQFNRTSTVDGPALVVQDTIKMLGQADGQTGREYDFNGNLLAGQYVNPEWTDCYDGATDGRQNWSIAHNDFDSNFAVIVGDANWANLKVAFVPQRRSSGVTFDATDGSLWISNNVGGSDRVQHFTTGGQLLGEFPVSGLSSGGGYGIALDPADGTLWLTGAFGTAGNLYQYDKQGNQLFAGQIQGLSGNVMGAEFRIPEPASLALLALASLIMRRR